LRELLESLKPAEFVAQVTELDSEHPLYPDVLAVVRAIERPNYAS
jgi:hypothetical protein